MMHGSGDWGGGMGWGMGGFGWISLFLVCLIVVGIAFVALRGRTP